MFLAELCGFLVFFGCGNTTLGIYSRDAEDDCGVGMFVESCRLTDLEHNM